MPNKRHGGWCSLLGYCGLFALAVPWLMQTAHAAPEQNSIPSSGAREAAAEVADMFMRDDPTQASTVYLEGQSQRWELYRNRHDCSLLWGSDGEPQLWIRYDYRLDQITIYLQDYSLNSLISPSSYVVNVIFDPEPKNRPNRLSFQARASFSDRLQLVYRVFGTELLDSFAASNQVDLRTSAGARIRLFPLFPEARPVDKLRKCAKEIAAESPSDPFESR